jgi:hypothetical protein
VEFSPWIVLVGALLSSQKTQNSRGLKMRHNKWVWYVAHTQKIISHSNKNLYCQNHSFHHKAFFLRNLATVLHVGSPFCPDTIRHCTLLRITRDTQVDSSRFSSKWRKWQGFDSRHVQLVLALTRFALRQFAHANFYNEAHYTFLWLVIRTRTRSSEIFRTKSNTC